MAEVLATIATILQLVDTALKAREYVKDFQDASEEQRSLFSEMENLKVLLGELQKRVQSSISSTSLQQLSGPLAEFKTTMSGFTARFQPATSSWSKFRQQLAWSLWSKKEAKEYLIKFERIKSLLNIWLSMDIW
jgi:hypothetical protein